MLSLSVWLYCFTLCITSLQPAACKVQTVKSSFVKADLSCSTIWFAVSDTKRKTWKTVSHFTLSWPQRHSQWANQAAWLHHHIHYVSHLKHTTCITQCSKGLNCLRYSFVACLPCECWSRGLGGGPIPLCPPCLIDSPLIWLKRLSSLMLFSCRLSMGCGRNQLCHNQSLW